MKKKFLIIIAGVAIIACLVFLSFGNRQDSQVPVSSIEETQVDESIEEVVPETTEEDVIETEEEESMEEVVTQPEEAQGVSEEATDPQPETEEVVEEEATQAEQEVTQKTPVEESNSSEVQADSESMPSKEDIISKLEANGMAITDNIEQRTELYEHDGVYHEGLNWE